MKYIVVALLMLDMASTISPQMKPNKIRRDFTLNFVGFFIILVINWEIRL